MAKKLDKFVIIYLNNIFILTKNIKQANIKAVQFVFYLLDKFKFLTNQVKYWFYQKEIQFLGYFLSV